jgi:hypothetical protein
VNLPLLQVDSTNKLSQISESGAKTQVNIHPAGKNLTTRQSYDLEDPPCGNSSWQQSRSRSGSHLSLHMSSTWYLSRLSVGGPYTIPIYITVGMMRHRPTQWPSKLLSLRDPINLHASVHNQCLLIRAQMMWSLTDTGGSYHLGASNIF